MRHAEDEALTQGVSAITLSANEKMHENIALYTKSGFIETGRRTENGFNPMYFRKDPVTTSEEKSKDTVCTVMEEVRGSSYPTIMS